ncbi:MAG: cytochrome C, partial [Ignavibacteria bacterium]
YHPADKSVNLSLSLGRIDETLPYIKSVAVDVLEESYITKEEGLENIEQEVIEFYKISYPDVYAKKKNEIESATNEIKKIYDRNYFPSMGVSWRGFPNHLSHLYDDGCFRCHDGNHVSEDGKVIGRSCDLCHTIVAQITTDGKKLESLNGIEFIHPEELDEDLNEVICVDCHARE